MAQSSHHPIAAIASVDLHGYSRLTEQDEVGTHRALMDCWRQQLTPIVDDHQGFIVKSTGDGALIRFSDAPAAVNAMIRFQGRVTRAEAFFPQSRRLIFRIGIHLAPTIQENGDVFGHGVNLAVRLQEAAEPGTIWLSETVFSHLGPEAGRALKGLGKQRFKNIDERVRVYCWQGDDASSSRHLRPILLRIAALLFLTLIMPYATSENIEPAPQGQDMLGMGSATGIADNTTLLSPEHAFVIPLGSDMRMAPPASSAIETDDREERSKTAEEWIQPYHGLVAGPLTATVRTTLAAAERSLENRSEIAEDAYLQALALYGRHTPSAFARAIDELDRALILKADYGAAHALLAAIYWGGLQNRWQLGQGLTRGAMLGLAEHHLALAACSSPLAEMVASEMLTARGRHDLAIQRAELAVALSPENAVGHYTKGSALLFAGRTAEAEGPIRTAIRLDPHAPRYLFGLALVQFNLGRFLDARRTLARVTVRNSDDDWPYLLLAATQGYLGQKADARRAIGRFDRLSLERRGWFASQIPYVHSWPFQGAENRNRLHRGLVLAGIPEADR